MHNVVGFVCNLHEFIKHLSAIFLALSLRRRAAFYEKLKFIAEFFYDVIISPARQRRCSTVQPANSPSKDYKM